MSHMKIVFPGVVLLLLSGCGSLRPPEPLDSNSSLIGIAVKNRGLIKLFSNTPDRVYFVRLEDGSDPYTATRLLPSNYAKGRYIYLLNAEPGRYVAVASLLVQRTPTAPTTRYTVYFSEDLIKVTEVTVGPASINFMGEYVVDMATGMKDADNAQLHYYRLIEPGAEKAGGLLTLFSGEYSYRGSLHGVKREPESEAKFLDAVEKRLGDTGWSDIISRHRPSP